MVPLGSCGLKGRNPSYGHNWLRMKEIETFSSGAD